MKRFLYGVLSFGVVIIGLGFAFKNATIVNVRYYGGLDWRAPLALVLLVVLSMGVVLGFLGGVSRQIRLRRQLSQARKQLRDLEQEVENLRALPIKDVL